MAILLVVLGFSVEAIAANYGGCWVKFRSIGLSTTLEAISHSPSPTNSSGDILLGQNYYTIIDSVSAQSSLRTRGVNTNGYFDFRFDTSGSDTTALGLDVFMGRTVSVNMFVLYIATDTLFITVEQAFSYRPPASDTCIADGSTSKFNDGFFVTDTLFQASMNATLDTLYIPAKSDSGNSDRFLRDSFVIQAPLVRLKIRNHKYLQSANPLHFELYVRNRDEIFSGAASRQLDRWQPPQSNYRK